MSITEKRKITIHGREYWLTRDELERELGCEPEDCEKIWKSLTDISIKMEKSAMAIELLFEDALRELANILGWNCTWSKVYLEKSETENKMRADLICKKK